MAKRRKNPNGGWVTYAPVVPPGVPHLDTMAPHDVDAQPGPFNRLTLDRLPEHSRIVVPVVDGVPLHEQFDERFEGLDITVLAPPSKQWLGEPTLVEYGRAVVLDGSCGVAGCCGVVARISLGARRVVWDEFYGHGAPPVPEGLRFVFERKQYESALQTLKLS